MSDLSTFIDAWSDSAEAVSHLADGLDVAQWNRATDLPGWSVRDILAHLSHIEATSEPPRTDPGPPVVSQDFTEAGVSERRNWPIDQVLTEFRTAVAETRTVLATPPADPSAPAARTPGGIAWDWQTLLRNRAFDMWMHEQDMRRALDVPGNLASAGGRVSRDVLASTMGYVLGRKVGAAPGTSVRWVVYGPLPLDLTVTVGEDGRARVIGHTLASHSATLTMGSESFIVVAGGRRAPETVTVDVTGDTALADAVLQHMALKV